MFRSLAKQAKLIHHLTALSMRILDRIEAKKATLHVIIHHSAIRHN